MVSEFLLEWPDRPRLQITMLSDWHVGLGIGQPGNVDRLIVRDRDDLPYIPAKTLTGMWRDACERLAFGLDGGEHGGWSKWVRYLFGDQPARRGETDPTQAPRPAVLSVRSAHLPAVIVARLQPLRIASDTDDNSLETETCKTLYRTEAERRSLRGALTFVKPGVKIDRRNGRAQEDHLRFEEMARMGAVLTADLSVMLPEDPTKRAAAIALLVASAHLVERIGGKRRRGAGRCHLKVEGLDVNGAIAWLEARQAAPDVPVETMAAGVTTAQHASGGDWMTISYELELGGPLAVSTRTVGNVVESLDFLPGTHLLPHITQSLRSLGIDARPAIACGDLRVLPATVAIGDQPGRPVPFALFQEKEGGGLDKPTTLINRLFSDPTPETKQVKQCRSGYLGLAAPDRMPGHSRVTMTMRTHNTVEEESQRPTTEVGGVYSYEAIAVRRLRGVLRLRKELWERLKSNPQWKKTLEGPCRLGRSKKDDYGAATLKVDGAAVPASAALPCQNGRLVVWVLSDVLLRDERLRPDPSVGAFRRELQQKLDPAQKLGLELALDVRLTRVRRTESWHVPWGLPRPSLIALQAGSCVVFRVTGNLTVHELSRVEAEGVGERTAEGYGEVRFNEPLLLGSPSTRKPPIVQSQTLPHALPRVFAGDGAFDYARRIEEEAWREAIRRAALSAGERRHELLGWQTEKPSMSQLGGLRAVLQPLKSREHVQIAVDWLVHLAQKRAVKWPGEVGANSDQLTEWLGRYRIDSAAAGKWPTGRRSQAQLGAIDRVGILLTDPDRVWTILDCHAENEEQWPALTDGAEQRLKNGLWATAVRSVIDACVRAQKRELDRASATGRS